MASIQTGHTRPGEDSNRRARATDRTKARRGGIIFVLPGLGAGGAERVVNIIANELAARGRTVSVIAFEEPDAPSYYDYAAGVSLVRLGLPARRQPWPFGGLASVARVVRLRRAMATIEPDSVVSFLTRTNVLALLATIGTDIPVIVSERNNPRLQDFGHVWGWLRARVYRRAFGLVTMTQGAMDCFPPAMRRRQWIIPNPAMTAAHVPVSGDTTKWLVAVGRLVPQKGFDLLLQTFARIAPAFPDWELVIWGEGPERGALEATARELDIDRRVLLPGVSANPGAWMALGDLFVMSSRFEGWGNALLEALAAGMPAIAFDCPWGPGQMIEHGVNGMLVPSDNVEAMAQGLAALMRDPALRARLGDTARQSMGKFATANVVTAWEAVIDESIAARSDYTARRPVTS
ncbi:glycosyltransferase family 4 protein [Sphingomonas cavernae]|uniref:Glycosyltransferase family 4 protein n=1 Tax=Sphingomonas cavernae TaxID=2320861 RepID=A0A418WSI4_9SPHN|nr:glycosyltransferase family 4 protein [Sphingomonas cavernae]RJF94230.1 glycosyltransferase family 4 protein [Sphingomonas cavernae]